MDDNQADSSPLITVAMPVYNAGEFLGAAVNSIVAQTYTNWELLVIDDGSTDNSLDSIADIQDGRVRILRDGFNKGLAARLNEAIDLARGQYFARMDQDDISMPERFKLQVAALEANPNLDLVASRTVTINSKNQIIGQLPFALTHQQICAKPWRSFYMPHPTWLGRIEWFRKYQYRVPQSYYSEDCELLLRSYKNSKFACVPEILVEYRVKDKINWKNQLRARKAVLKLQTSHFFNRQQYLYIALSWLIFSLRVALDSCKLIKQSIRRA